MVACFEVASERKSVPISIVSKSAFSAWLANLDPKTQSWLAATDTTAEAGAIRLIPDATDGIASVFLCVSANDYFWEIGLLPYALPEGLYHFVGLAEASLPLAATIWALGAYKFERYKKAIRMPARLSLTESLAELVIPQVEATYLVRDLINTPTDDMGPSELAREAENLAKNHQAQFKQIVGDDLLQQNYPCIYTVGRASDDAPRLIDIRWGKESDPKVTLVGKGVCFDTGGLDIKPSAYMLLMKKDMGGSANVLGLAQLIMQARLPIRLRVLIPALENAISGNAYRPGDVIKSRQGLTIEVGNTDAEGRVILADALTEAVSEQPDLVIDMATLTGAARVAVGTEIAAVFSNNDALVNRVMALGEKEQDYIWRLPLFAAYRDQINSNIADINNNPVEPYAGAIIAALFLKAFVPDEIPWLHFDIMAWNTRTKAGRPVGGEAMAIRALFRYLKETYTMCD